MPHDLTLLGIPIGLWAVVVVAAIWGVVLAKRGGRKR